MANFINARTVEQFKSEEKVSKLNFHYAWRKEGDAKLPVYINDAQGNPTNVQAIAIHDDAGNTRAWCSREVAAEIAAGKSITSSPLSFVDIVDSETGAFLGTKLVHPKTNAIEGLSL